MTKIIDNALVLGVGVDTKKISLSGVSPNEFSEVKIPLQQQSYAVSFCRILELNHSLRGLGGCQIWKPTQMSYVKCFGCLDYVMDHTTRLNREHEMANQQNATVIGRPVC